ncbi:MAG TPA: TraR/DksA C4-type zinc finger protein [Acidimicrobiales bacterium]|nr:TraR/DksA C4-type zinc finger protein [Acidimicrobiales bacterium]
MELASTGRREMRLTEEQVEELAAALREIVRNQRRRLRREQVAFRSLTLHDATSARRRRQARHAASTAYRIGAAASRALAALEDGAYGTCVRCGRSLPFDRLRERPLAVLCAGCDEA